MYPFLFHKPNYAPCGFNILPGGKWYVKIAKCFDYVSYNSSWMDDETLGKDCLVPDVDIEESMHEFDTEAEAINFIREWWHSS